MDWLIPLGDIDFGAEEENAVLDVLRRRWLTMGAVTQLFEKEFADSVGARHAIAVNNATAALVFGRRENDRSCRGPAPGVRRGLPRQSSRPRRAG